MKKNKRKNIGEQLSSILSEIENALWDNEYNNPTEKPNFTENGFRASIKIFMSALMDKMWEKQKRDKMSFKDREKQAEYFGKEIKELVVLATGIDTYKLCKKGKENYANK